MEAPLEVADIFRQHGVAYQRSHAGRLAPMHYRVMRAIARCRTMALGGHVERCEASHHQRISYNSCRNRHCPKCQSLARAQWLEDRQAELLECEYFHVVFTLPQEIAAMAYQNKAALYDLLFRASAEALTTIAADPKHLGAHIGFLAILHTWGQNLMYHPHVHCVVPGGGLSLDGQRWIACRPGFFLPVRVLSRLFRRLYCEGLKTLFAKGQLTFTSDLAPLHERAAFEAALAPLQDKEWVVCTPSAPSAARNRGGPMTCEVVVMNKRGIALAADSAVTLSDGDGNASKVYYTAEKLFCLSPDLPVAIYISLDLDNLICPWQPFLWIAPGITQNAGLADRIIPWIMDMAMDPHRGRPSLDVGIKI